MVLSPEYVYAIRPDNPMPDDRRFGVFWLPRTVVAAALGLQDAFNCLSLTLAPGAREAAVKIAVDRLLEPHGGRGATGRDQQRSHRMVADELDQQKVMATTIPAIFFSVAAFLLHLVVSRLFATEREIIATLKALGFSSGPIVFHYLAYTLVVVGLGCVAGIGFGYWQGNQMVGLYQRYFRFPELHYTLDPGLVVVGCLVFLGLAVLSVADSVRAVLARQPAEAMRPAPPPPYRPGFLDRSVLVRILTPAGRLALRGILRRPWQTALTSLGIALGMAVVILGLFWWDGMRLGTILPAAAPLRDLRTERDLRERAGAAEASLARVLAAVRKAEAALEAAKLELDRTRNLVASGASPSSVLDHVLAESRMREQELSAARQEAHAQEHELEVARLALDRLGGSRERAEIRSPLEGRVLRVLQESEAVVAPGAPLLELGRHGDLEVVVDLLSSDAVQVKAGMAVRLAGWGGPELEGRVRRVEPGAFTKISPLGVEEQRVNVRMDLTATPERWAELGDGFRIEVRILTQALPRVLKVPTATLFREKGGWATYLLDGRHARKRSISIGQRNAQEAEVLAGVREGEQVILYPGEQVADGVRVRAER